MYEKQWPVAEAGMSAVKVRQAAMALTTGSLWSESHQTEQTNNVSDRYWPVQMLMNNTV